jgi:hypothetical protein
MKLEVFTAVKVQVMVFWVVTLSNDVIEYPEDGGSRVFQNWYSVTSLHSITIHKTMV